MAGGDRRARCCSKEAFDVRQRNGLCSIAPNRAAPPGKNDGRSDVVERAVFVVGRWAVCRAGLSAVRACRCARALSSNCPAPVFGEGVVYQVLQGDLLGEENGMPSCRAPPTSGESVSMAFGIAAVGILCRREHVTAGPPVRFSCAAATAFENASSASVSYPCSRYSSPSVWYSAMSSFVVPPVAAAFRHETHRLRVAFDRPSQVAGIVVYSFCRSKYQVRAGTLGPGAVALVIIQCGAVSESLSASAPVRE